MKSTSYPPEIDAYIKASSILYKQGRDLLFEAGRMERKAGAIVIKKAESLLELSADKLVYCLAWPCPGPLGVCVFNKEEDPRQDNCLFCHNPTERK